MAHPGTAQLVIFGLTGDLSRRKLLPALYQLTRDNVLPERLHVIGITRRDVSAAQVLEPLRHDPNLDPAVVARLTERLQMVQMELTSPDEYRRLKTLLDEQERASGECFPRLFYLSMPPQVFGPVIDLLGRSGLSAGCSHGSSESRLLVEKPFGFDLHSARELLERIDRQFGPNQIYRIDHYLAKESTQNLLAFRTHNPLFEAAWDARHIERITITAAERIGVEGRAIFYEQTGALRDVIQNHLLQLLALIAMEPPTARTPEALQAAKLKLLQAIPAPSPDTVAAHAIRGQYNGYRTEVDNPTSRTETFAAVKLSIDNQRWRGVPIVLQTGKALDQKVTEIVLTFRPQPDQSATNHLTIRIEPKEGICLDLIVKKPGLETEFERAEMDFRYARSFAERQPDAYEYIIADAMRGDRTLFTTSAETLESWRIVDPIVAEWGKSDASLLAYEPGTAASELSAPLFK